MMKPLFTRAGWIALAWVAASGLIACGKKEAPGAAARPPAQVSTITVQPRDVPVDFEYVAQTESSRQVNIQARVAGFLDKRVYTEGGLVREGQPLFLMDPKPLQAQVDQAAAALASTQAAHATAVANLERIKPLAQLNALSQADLDNANGTFLTSKAAVEQSKAALETARLNLSYATITSPVTGVAGSAQQADGTYISASNSLLTTVYVLSPIWVNFSISENVAQTMRDQVKSGKLRVPADGNYKVEVLLVDGSVFPYAGRITFADPSFNSQTGTFQVRASVNNPDGLLRPNQFVRAKIKGAVRPNAVLVPQRAVQQGAKSHFVWLVKDGKAEYRPVQVGDWLGDDWFITDGLAAGDEVVVDGVLMLAPGAPVAAKPLAAAAQPAAAGAKAETAAAPAAPAAAKPEAGAGEVAKIEAKFDAEAAVLKLRFASASAALDADAKAAIAKLAAELKGSAAIATISGYVDSKGKPEANAELAKRRARAVRDALEDAGVPIDRLRLGKPAQIVGGGDDAAARHVAIRTSAAAR